VVRDLGRDYVGLLGRQNGRGVFKDQVVAAVGEELFAQMLRRMQVFARRVFPLAFSLNGIEASGDAAVLNFDLLRRVSEFAFVFGATAFVALILAADFQRQPTRVLLSRQRQHGRHAVHQVRHVYSVCWSW